MANLQVYSYMWIDNSIHQTSLSFLSSFLHEGTFFWNKGLTYASCINNLICNKAFRGIMKQLKHTGCQPFLLLGWLTSDGCI